MGAETKIEWTATVLPDGTICPGATFNCWWGCVEAGPECDNCYARTLDARWHADNPHWGISKPRLFAKESYWQQLEKWNEKAKRLSEQFGVKVQIKVFVNSMSDFFETLNPNHLQRAEMIAARERLCAAVERFEYLIFIFLTKRPSNMLRYVPETWNQFGWPANAWALTTVGHPDSVGRIDQLLEVPAHVHGLSMEPLLGPIDLSRWLAVPGEWKCPRCRYRLHKRLLHGKTGEAGVNTETVREVCPNDGATLVPASYLDWVIVGGESGKKARPMHPDWVRFLRDQCQAAGVAWHFKQWGEWLPFDQGGVGTPTHQFGIPGIERVASTHKVGKSNAGRLLDGREWNEFPEVMA